MSVFALNDSFNINQSTNAKTAPPIEYGQKFFMHLVRIWNLRISYPNDDLFLWYDDVSGAFRQGKYNPEISGAFSFIIFGLLWLPCGMVFGGNTSPQCYDPLANAREHHARHFSCDEYNDLVQKHWDILKHVQMDNENSRYGIRVGASRCNKYNGVINLPIYIVTLMGEQEERLVCLGFTQLLTAKWEKLHTLAK